MNKKKEDVSITRYRDGVGWTVEADSLEHAEALYSQLLEKHGNESGYFKSSKKVSDEDVSDEDKKERMRQLIAFKKSRTRRQ